MKRVARELEPGDAIRWRGRWHAVALVDVEHQVIRLTLDGGAATLRLGTWWQVPVAA